MKKAVLFWAKFNFNPEKSPENSGVIVPLPVLLGGRLILYTPTPP